LGSFLLDFAFEILFVKHRDSIEYCQSYWRISICNYKSLLRHFSQTFSQTHHVFEITMAREIMRCKKKARTSKLGRPVLLLNGFKRGRPKGQPTDSSVEGSYATPATMIESPICSTQVCGAKPSLSTLFHNFLLLATFSLVLQTPCGVSFTET
jgi:hypothetical protein